jgi:hypothetical protein
MHAYRKRVPQSTNRGGARHRRNGDRCEREIIARHAELGIRGERYPSSGASCFRGSGHDAALYIFGTDAAPALCEVKSRKDGSGFRAASSDSSASTVP